MEEEGESQKDSYPDKTYSILYSWYSSSAFREARTAIVSGHEPETGNRISCSSQSFMARERRREKYPRFRWSGWVNAMHSMEEESRGSPARADRSFPRESARR